MKYAMNLEFRGVKLLVKFQGIEDGDADFYVNNGQDSILDLLGADMLDDLYREFRKAISQGRQYGTLSVESILVRPCRA